MRLPELNPEGELPQGVHRATLDEVLLRFGSGSSQRRDVAARLSRIHALAITSGGLDRLIVFGSFITNKPEPRDVDVVLIMRDDFELATCPFDAQGLFDHVRAETEFSASVFWIRPSMLILESLDDFVAGWQGKRGGGKRGIVEVFR